MKRYLVLFAGLPLILGGCQMDRLRGEEVVERTPLENRVLGSYNALAEGVLIDVSARGVDPLGNPARLPRRSRQQRDVIGAMQLLAFHADDVDAFKRLGWVGERNDGLLEPFPMSKESTSADLRDFAARYDRDHFEAVVAAVNGAREMVMRRVVENEEGLDDSDLPKVRAVFGAIHAEKADPGDKIQLADGTWTEKP